MTGLLELVDGAVAATTRKLWAAREQQPVASSGSSSSRNRNWMGERSPCVLIGSSPRICVAKAGNRSVKEQRMKKKKTMEHLGQLDTLKEQ